MKYPCNDYASTAMIIRQLTDPGYHMCFTDFFNERNNLNK